MPNITPKHCLLLCQNALNLQKDTLLAALNDLKTANESDTKSSAGDKYETSVEMIQQEKVQLFGQLKVVEDQWMVLNRLSLQQEKGFLGALYVTNLGSYYISVGLGKLSNGVMAISAQSPLAEAFKQNLSPFNFRDQTFEVLERL